METNQMTPVMEWGQRHAVEIVKGAIKSCTSCKHLNFEMAQGISLAICKVIGNKIPDQDIEGFYCNRFVAKLENQENKDKKLYDEAKEEFKFFKKKFDGEIINEEQFNTINKSSYVIVWNNGRSGIHYGLTWYSAYLVKPDYKESFNREPKENEVKDSFEFYYYRG